MSVQPDIIWNEQCLGIRIGEQVCIYLKKHNAEYQRLTKENTGTYREVSSDRNIYGSGSVNQSDSRRTSGTAPIFQLENGKEMIEEEYHFYMGQAQMISYGAMLRKNTKKQCQERTKVIQRNYWNC